MHEISLCESIRDIIEEQAARERFSRVRRVCLEIGVLSCVEPEALRFGFDVVMRGSVAEDAELEILSPPATAMCLTCFETAEVTRRYDACPSCGAATMQVTGGEDMRIRELEVI